MQILGAVLIYLEIEDQVLSRLLLSDPPKVKTSVCQLGPFSVYKLDQYVSDTLTTAWANRARFIACLLKKSIKGLNTRCLYGLI